MAIAPLGALMYIPRVVSLILDYGMSRVYYIRMHIVHILGLYIIPIIVK